ncbi:hypothetical protein [Hyphomicrobium sp. CS1GBMeth3]|uniref:hypothetical protein n=1 Tax=Hyphomicrobium sp. CS1GBMeth3 TaxID=1892845 RepID=UPI000930B986|nr:hypothetical protein [Hyphomicrobium sp. CS1GBMeth3]
MRCLTLTAALVFAAGSAFAASEGKFSQATVNGITKSLAADGCKLGEIHSGSGFYTIAGADCADGKYDVTVDTDFKITDKKK